MWIVWLVVAPIQLYWRWVVVPMWLKARQLLDPRTIGVRDALASRLGLARTMLVAVGALLAELQWRWGTPDFGRSAIEWFNGLFTGPVVLAGAVLLCSATIVLTAQRGHRLPMLRRVLVPARAIVTCVLVIAVLPLSAWALSWVQQERHGALEWASDGLPGLLIIVISCVMIAAVLSVPPLLISGAWLAARGSFRAGDAHPLLPAVSAIVAGVALIARPIVDGFTGKASDPDYPVWAGLILGVVLPAAAVVISVIEVARLVTVGRLDWRRTYDARSRSRNGP